MQATTNALGQIASFTTTPIAAGSGYTFPFAIAEAPTATLYLNIPKLNISRPGASGDLPDLQATILHELGEILGVGGAGSALNIQKNPSDNTPIANAQGPAVPGPLDLFRYTAPTQSGGSTIPGVRSYNYLLQTQAFLSIDGGKTDLGQFNQEAGQDFGDWISAGHPTPQVQDSTQVSGSMPDLGSAELTALNVIGYTLNDNLPKLEISMIDNVFGKTTLGSDWTWTLQIKNEGTAAATFYNGQFVVLDELPNTDIKYTALSVLTVPGEPDYSSMILGTVTSADFLSAKANGTLTIAPGSVLDIVVTAVALAAGTFANPSNPPPPGEPGINILPSSNAGVAVVDPYGVIADQDAYYDNAAPLLVPPNYALPDTVTVSAGLKITSSPIITNENKSNVTVAGTGSIGYTVSVYLKDSNGNSTNTVTATVQPDGTWTAKGLDATNLAPGQVEVFATQGSIGGNVTASAAALVASGTVSANLTNSATAFTEDTAATTAPTFYWQLLSGYPNVNTDFADADTFSNADETSSMTLSASPGETDQLDFSVSGEYDSIAYTSFSDTATDTWTGAPPTIILPGQMITLQAHGSASHESGGGFDQFARAYNSPNVIVSYNGTDLNGLAADVSSSTSYGANSSSISASFTAPESGSVPIQVGSVTESEQINAIYVEEFATPLPLGADPGTGEPYAYENGPTIYYIYDRVYGSLPAAVSFTSTPDITNANVKNVSVAGNGVAGAAVSVVIGDGMNTTTPVKALVASNGGWTVSGIDASDLAIGPVTYQVYETTSSGATGSDTQTANLNLLSFTTAPNISFSDPKDVFASASGTGLTSGDNISVTISDGTHTTPALTTTVGPDGTWSVADVNASTLVNGPVTYSVSETDLADNVTTATQTATKIAAPAVAFTSTPNITHTNVQDVSVAGTGDDGDTIYVDIADSLDNDGFDTTPAATTTVSGGAWSVSGINGSGLADGQITYIVTEIDKHGDLTAVLQAATKQTTAPVAFTSTPDITTSTQGSIAAAGTGVSGDKISVTITDAFGKKTTAATTTVGANDTWSVSGINAAGLANGTVTYTATASDSAGDTGTAEQAAVKGALAFTSTPNITAGNVGGVSVSGTGQSGDQITVYVTDALGNSTEIATTNVRGDGAWSVTGINPSAVSDGPVTYFATETYAGGNAATIQQAAAKGSFQFTGAPDITSANQGNVTVAGTGNSGDTIFVTISDSFGNTTSPVTTTVAADGTWSVTGIDASAFAAGPVTYQAIDADQDITITQGGTKTAAAVVISVTANTTSVPANSTTLTIAGSGFGAADTVTLSSGSATVTNATSTSLTFSVSGLQAGPLSAIVSNGSVKSASTPVGTVTPVINASTVSLAANGTSLVINGFGFDTKAANDILSFGGGVTGTLNSATLNQLTVTKLSGLVGGSLTASVQVDGQSSGTAVQVAAMIPLVTAGTGNLAANGPSLTIKGVGFSSTAANDTVTFSGGATGTVSNATPTQLTVTGFTGLVAGILTASVTVNGQSSTAVQVATVQPVVTSSTNTQAASTTTLTIYGFGFSSTIANDMVKFSGTATGTIISATATQLNITSLTGLVAGNLSASVTVSGQSSGTAMPVATVTPVVTAGATVLGANGTTLVISGFGFSSAAAGDALTFSGGVKGTVGSATATQLNITGLTGLVAGSLSASVTISGQSSGPLVPVAAVTPVVTAATTALTASATTLTIHGFGFAATSSGDTLTLSGGATGTITGGTTTQLTVTSLSGLVGGSLTASVAVSGQSSSTVQVATVQPLLTISTIDLAANGPSLLIYGSGFSGTAANDVVTFSGGATGTVSSAMLTQLTVTNLTGLVAGNLSATVKVNGQSSPSTQVATVQPVVTANTTNLSGDAASLVIDGFGFSSTAASNKVTFNTGTGNVTGATATTLTVTGLSGLVLGTLTATVTSNSR